MNTNQDELEKLLADYAYEVYITNDLEDAEQDKEQRRLLDIYKQRLQAYVDKKVREARVDENLACCQIMAQYRKTSEMVEAASERRKEFNISKKGE